MSGSLLGPGEFRFAVTPQTLLFSAVPDPIWPPFDAANFLV